MVYSVGRRPTSSHTSRARVCSMLSCLMTPPCGKCQYGLRPLSLPSNTQPSASMMMAAALSLQFFAVGGGIHGRRKGFLIRSLIRCCRLSVFRRGGFRFILPNEMFQLDAARVSRCFPGSGAGSLRQFFCQCQGSVPVLKLAQQADGGEAGVVEPVPVPAFVGGTSAGRMGQNGGIVIQCLFFVRSFVHRTGPAGSEP